MSERVFDRDVGEAPRGWTESLRTTAGACSACGGPVVTESYSVPCCGGEYPCTDDNALHMCNACRTYAYDW